MKPNVPRPGSTADRVLRVLRAAGGRLYLDDVAAELDTIASSVMRDIVLWVRNGSIDVTQEHEKTVLGVGKGPAPAPPTAPPAPKRHVAPRPVEPEVEEPAPEVAQVVETLVVPATADPVAAVNSIRERAERELSHIEDLIKRAQAGEAIPDEVMRAAEQPASSGEAVRCPNADSEPCSYPNCVCHHPMAQPVVASEPSSMKPTVIPYDYKEGEFHVVDFELFEEGDLTCALWNDGKLVIRVDQFEIRFSPRHTEALVHYLDRLAPQED
jgi:hypothetical protein